MAETPIGGSPLDSGGGPEVASQAGQTSVNARTKSVLDSSEFKTLNKEFKDLNTHLNKFKSDLPGVIRQTKEWANALKGVSQNMSGISGGGGNSYLPNAGAGTAIGSGNVISSTKQVIIGGGGVGGGTPIIAGGGMAGVAGMAMSAFDKLSNMFGSVMQATDARIAQGAAYSLSADRMNMLYQQMSGLSTNQVQQSYRMPLTNYRLGATGVNDLLGFQARTGISSQMMAPAVESLRAASGFGLGTSDILNLTQTLTSPQVNNRMFMMLGTGLYGIGGATKDPRQLFEDVIKRTGLTNAENVRGAFQQGSFQRARLLQAGMPEDSIDLLLQYAQQNLAFQGKTGGGQGFYDPSKKEHARLMGVDSNYAMQFEETARTQMLREEKFANRQTDNFAKMEENTQALLRLTTSVEELTSGLIGAAIETAPVRKSGAVRGAGSFLKNNAGWLMAVPKVGPILAGAAYVGGSLMEKMGDPMEDSKGAGGARGPTSTTSSKSGEADPDNVQKSRSKLSSLNPRFAERIIDMMRDNPNLYVSSAKRSSATQKAMFLDRYQPTEEKTNLFWAGSYWKHVKGAPAAPPGLSMHEIGLAADLAGDMGWVAKNAHKYGLKSFADVNNEPWHVQPAELPNGRSAYEKAGSPWGTSGEKFDPSTIWNGLSVEKAMDSTVHSEGTGSSNYGGVGGGGAFAWSDMSMSDIVNSTTYGAAGFAMRGGMTGESGGPENATAAVARSATGGGGGALSGPEIAKVLYNAGFRGENLKRAIAFAWRESRFNPRATNFSGKERSYGLLQINMNDEAVKGLNGPGMGKTRARRHKIGSYDELFDPQTNARVAYEIWSGKWSDKNSREQKFGPGGWAPWGGNNRVSPDSIKRAETYIREARLPEVDPSVSMSGPSVSSGGGGALYNISVSPVINISSSGNTSVDSQKMAREVTAVLEKQVRLTMMRTS